MRAHEQRLGRPLRDALAELYETKNMRQIAEQLGVSEPTISRWFDRMQISTGQRLVTGDASTTGETP